jgi:hypothetical protein
MKPSWPKTFVSFPSFCDLTSDFTEHQTRKSVSQFGATPCLRLKKKKKKVLLLPIQFAHSLVTRLGTKQLLVIFHSLGSSHGWSSDSPEDDFFM